MNENDSVERRAFLFQFHLRQTSGIHKVDDEPRIEVIDDIADTLQRFVRQAGDILQVGVAGRTAADQGKKIQGSLFRVQLASFMRIGNLIALLFRLCKNRRPRFFADRLSLQTSFQSNTRHPWQGFQDERCQWRRPCS